MSKNIEAFDVAGLFILLSHAAKWAFSKKNEAFLDHLGEVVFSAVLFGKQGFFRFGKI